MTQLKGSRTEKNLLAAFAGESQARNRYDYFAKKAQKEGYVQISAIFEKTAEQEKQHAKRFFQFLEGGETEITASFPAGTIESTEENLRAAAAGEEHEWRELYPGFAKIAAEEGFPEIAMTFKAVSVAEEQHGKRYAKLADNIAKGRVFKQEGETVWQCRKCGYAHEGKEAPGICPACLHPQSYFELSAENW